MKRTLERIEIPDEHGARERAWALAKAAYAEREPQPAGRPVLRPLLLACALGAVVAAALTPPGRAVIETVREAVGVESADEALLALPTEGRMLVHATSGPWIVAADGTRRALRDLDQVSWSPRGLYVAATRGRELLAVTPRGDVRWRKSQIALAAHPRWAPSGFRIAYMAGASVHVIAGDGTGDRRLARDAVNLAPTWRPGANHVVTFVAAGNVVTTMNADTQRTLWRARVAPRPHSVLWSADGRRLLVLTRSHAWLFDSTGRRIRRVGLGGIPQFAAFAPRGTSYAVVVGLPGRSEVRVGRRVVFAGDGAFNAVEWSPDGRWLLIGWASADQWVFVRSGGAPRIRAVGNIAAQFESEHFPQVTGWCCP